MADIHSSSSMSISTTNTLRLSVSDGYPEEYRLLELTPEILAQLDRPNNNNATIEDEKSLLIRGREADIAALIDTEDRAYKMVTAHTSNNLYLFTRAEEQQGSQDDSSGTTAAVDILLRASLNQTFELQKTQPQIHTRVLEVLGWDRRGPFRGTEFEQTADHLDAEQSDNDIHMADGSKDASRHEQNPTRISDGLLKRHVQAGDRTLHRVLAEIPAFREARSGNWRILDPGYCMDLLRLVLATQVEKEWSPDALDANDVYQALQSDADGDLLVYEVVEAVLARFGRQIQTSPPVYAIDSMRVAKYLAEQIFAVEDMRSWPVSEFLSALRATMPPQLHKGIADDIEKWSSLSIPSSVVRDLAYATTPIDAHLLYSANGISYHLTYLAPLFRSTLPSEPRVRMQKLFDVKSRWSRLELQPYLEDLVDVDRDMLEGGDSKTLETVNKTIDAWLIKFCRGVKSPGGQTVYSSRLK
ncbi:Ctf8p and Ctf18p associating protein [Coemansia sp. RSA 1813]|nr:Ctf8p and Ctf18p associating protein [Coemansia sp. RSA 1646]KAJ1767443.1 Ctf8p and Ctf18p associating protein [Coemansia sp. RSA 1843]KAJ2215528.1 Ctf8p and Ctf18p associating protein [Coemansia sp. RSA 487]KAJ2567180.1 Ctf8p and Ctf18p associating protein [Coemansia sp. RSA 1813]